MKWFTDLVEKHRTAEGGVDGKAVIEEFNAEFAKHAIPKQQYNDKVAELNAANTTLAELKNENQDVKALQEKITGYETEIENLKQASIEATKKHAIETALTKAGAEDIEYLMYKLGDVDLNEDGTIKDIDSKVKELKENNAKFFKEETAQVKTPEGFKTIENKLPEGAQPNEDATAQMIAAMTSDLPNNE